MVRVCMLDLYKRYVLFLVGCMGVRFGLAYWAKHASKDVLRLMSVGALILACSWMVLYVNDWRKTGAEVFGGKIWWTALRPIHAMLYVGFAYFAWFNCDCAWLWLLFDALLGLCVFGLHHGRGQSFEVV